MNCINDASSDLLARYSKPSIATIACLLAHKKFMICFLSRSKSGIIEPFSLFELSHKHELSGKSNSLFRILGCVLVITKIGRPCPAKALEISNTNSESSQSSNNTSPRLSFLFSPSNLFSCACDFWRIISGASTDASISGSLLSLTHLRE